MPPSLRSAIRPCSSVSRVRVPSVTRTPAAGLPVATSRTWVETVASRLTGPPDHRASPGLLDELGNHRWHIEDGGNQVVGEGGILDLTVYQRHLFHQRQAEALGAATLDLPQHALRVERATDVLRDGQLHHPDQTELGVDLDHCPRRAEGEGNVRIALPVRVELAGGTMMKDAGGFDRPAQRLHSALPLDLGAHRLAGELNGPTRHHRLPRGGTGTRGPDRGIGLADQDTVDAEFAADNLRDDRIQALTDLDRGRLHLCEPSLTVDRHPHPRLGGVVEAFAVAEVLVADGHADTAPERFSVADVAGAPRQQHRVAVERRLLRRKGKASQTLQALSHRGHADNRLAGRHER